MPNWLQDAVAQNDLWSNTGPGVAVTNQDGAPWWTLPSIGGTPSAYGQRLGSLRLQNLARQRAAQEKAQAELGGVQGAPQLSASVGIPAVQSSIKQPEPAPAWLTGAAGPGTWLRELVRPGKSVFERGGTVLEGAGKLLGSLAQGTETTIGTVTGQLPQLGGAIGEASTQFARDVNLGNIMPNKKNTALERIAPLAGAILMANKKEGLLTVKPSAANDATAQAADIAQVFNGQDFSKKYRDQVPWVNQSLTSANDAAGYAYGQATNIAYTGLATQDARQRAQLRMLLGEDPTVVMRGMTKPSTSAYADEVSLYNEKAQEFMAAHERSTYMAAVKQGANPAEATTIAAQAKDEAGRWIASNGRIPGEEAPLPEVIGQMVLDPLNLPGANMVMDAVTGSLVKKGLGVETATRNAVTVYDDSMKAALETYRTGLSATEQRLLGKAATSTSQLAQGLGKTWTAVRRYTPVTAAKRLAGTAFTQLGAMINDAPTGADALAVIQKFIENPDSLMATFGAVPRNLYSEAARPVVKAAFEKLKALESLKAPKFNAMAFLAEAMQPMEDAARVIAGAPKAGEKMTGLLAFAQSAKGWMSEFYLKTPGYIIRNYLSDNAVATMDGLSMFDNMDQVRARLEKFGITTSRVNAAGELVNATSDVIGTTSKLAQIPILKEIKPLVALQNKIGEISSKAEEARYIRAYESALQQFKGTNWAPKLSAATRSLFENAGMKDTADAIEAGWRQAQSAKDLRRTVGDVLNASHPAEQFFVTRFGIDPQDISPDLAVHLEQAARDLAKRGGTAEDWQGIVNKLIEDAKAKAASGMRDMGVITKPRATTAVDTLQDIADELRSAEQRIVQAVNHGEITKDEGKVILQRFKQGLEEQNKQRAVAVQALHDALGQVDPAAAEHVLSAALHPVDLEHEIRDLTRQQVDRLWIAEKRKPQNARDWAAYFDARRAAWGDAGSKTVDGYNKAVQAIKELGGLATPEEMAAVLSKHGITSLTDKADQLLQATRQRLFEINLNAPEYRHVPVGDRQAIEAQLQAFFDTSLKPQRVQWDEARAVARRYLVQMIKSNPELAQDGMDIWIAAQRAVDIRFTQAASKQEGWIGQMLADEISFEEYKRLSGEEWKKAFNFATTHNGEQTVARIKSMETRRGLVAQKLKELGYTGDELKRMVTGFSDGSTREEVAGIIRDNTRAPARSDLPAGVAPTSAPSRLESAMHAPATVDDWMAQHGGDAQAALSEAQLMQNELGALVDFGLTSARGEATSQVPTIAEINRHLNPDGQLRAGDREEALRDLADQYGFVANDQVAGGIEESYRAWLEQARNMRETARADPGKAASKAAEDAYTKWDEIITALQQQTQHAAGMTAEESALQDFVAQTLRDQGLAQGADTIRQLASGGDESAKLMMDALAQHVREMARNIMEGSDTVEEGVSSLEKLLADALFGERNTVELGGVTTHMADSAATSRALAEYRKSKGITLIPGLEHESRIDTIRLMAQELGLNPDDFVKGERGAQELLQAAQNANPDQVRDILAMGLRADGTVTIKDWVDYSAKYGTTSMAPRKPGDLLRELATSSEGAKWVGGSEWVGVEARRIELAARAAGVTTFDELKAKLGNDVLVMKSSDPSGVTVFVTDNANGIKIEGHGKSGQEALDDALKQLGIEVQPRASTPRAATAAATALPQAVIEAEARADAARRKVLKIKQELVNAVDQVEASGIKVRLEQAEAESKTAGMQAASARKKAGVLPPTTTTGTGPDDIPDAETLSAADAAVEAGGGSAEPLGMEDLLATAEKKQIEALIKIRDGMTADWGRLVDPKGLPKGAMAAVEAELRGIMPTWYTFRNAATYAAQARADFALLDYSMKRGGDMYAAAVAPYYYWGSRQGRNYAIRLMQRPQNIVALQRYQDTMKKEAQRQGLRGRFEGMWQVGDGLYLDPTALLFPWADIIKSDIGDASDSRSALANIYQAASQLGIRPGPYIDIPLRASNIMVGGTPGTPEYASEEASFGKTSIGSILPQTNMLKAATALAGIGTPGGIDVEQSVRRAMGLPESQPFEPYIVARAVRDLATERKIAQGQQTPYLLAQALISNAGDPTSGYGWSKLLNNGVTPQDVATQFNTTTDEAQAALQIVREAADKAGKQKGKATLASALGGMKVAQLPEGEKQYGQLQTMERGAGYNAATGTGSMADLQAVRDANPALAVGRAQYGTIAGETTDPTKIYQSAQRDTINQAFDALKDAVIEQKPWDRNAGMAVEDGRKAAIALMSPSSAGATSNATGWQAEYQKAIAAINGSSSTPPQTYKARSLYGANPTEAQQIRVDEALKFVAATRPRLTDYTLSNNMPDYASYSAAVTLWEDQLAQTAARNPQVQQVIQQAQADGYAPAVQKAMKDISVKAIQDYWQRNDSPLEAAQRSYFTNVYDPAIKAAKSGTKVVLTKLPDSGPVNTAELVSMTEKLYPNRWTPAELTAALRGMTMPGLHEVTMGLMSPKARVVAQAEMMFLDQVRTQYGQRGVDALVAYDSAVGADAKAVVRRRNSILVKLLPMRTEFMQQQ